MASVAKQAALEKVVEIANRVGASEGIEIVDVELLGGGRNRVLRIYIDKPGGVTHADCESVSEQVGTILDAEDAIDGGTYTLEVSSPGVERKLKSQKDFERFIGKRAKVLLRDPLENRRQWEGTIAEVKDGVIHLEASPGKAVEFPLGQVERANLKFEW
ncbi:MAG: ribosome maturation factor RimP [Acidobacteria bacterium]|nr:ribosome maturation factor RimP [Acidobacteriota bacterium]